MSASKDRANRKQQIAAGLDKRTIAAEKAAKERKKSNTRYIIVAAVLVVVFAFIFFYNSTWPYRHFTAVTIGDEDYTAAQTNYYYSASYNNFYNTYSYYLAYGLFFDPNTSLADQDFSEDMTWREYFIDDAETTMRQVQILNAAAEAAGYTLPADEQAAYEETLASFEDSWVDNGYSSLEQFINLNYGKGVTMDMIRDELYRTYVASSYSSWLSDSYSYTAEELSAYYAEHADELDEISYMYFEIYDDDDIDAQEVYANVFGMTEDEFSSYIYDTYGSVITTSSAAGDSLNSTYASWLLSSDRTVGDVTISVDDVNGITYVVMYLGRDTNDYQLASFRHILIMAEDTDADGLYSEEEIAAAQEKAQAIYDEWLAGNATEDSFAALADQYTEDTGSQGTGGLYEDVYKGQMVEVINDWLFDGTRQPGDTTIVVNDGSYTGVHVVYYVGQSDETYAESISDSALRSADYNEWITAQEETLPITEHGAGIFLCGKNH